MESKISYKTEEMELNDDFMDIGFMAENINVEDFYGNKITLKRSHSDKSMTLFISFPNAINGFLEEIQKIDIFISNIVVPINTYFIFSDHFEEQMALKNRLERFEIVFDKENDFGAMYGAKIMSGSLADKLTKSLFLISKDGAIFYIDMPEDLDTKFNLERLQIELNKAYLSYTGVGCHG